MITHYHAKYFAYELTKRCPSDSLEKLAGAVASAQVDLNPHQVDAALFAFNSPLSRGAVLADEVGLGKTIEAGLVLSQKWAERKRRLLVITPSNLRKQWHQELTEKFFLPCRILESKPYNESIKQGNFSPFQIKDHIVICSYQFARAKASDVAATPWDLVVIDEAHRLRNVYKPSNIIATTLKSALTHRRKLLLTATPLQNSLLELFGLVSMIDEHAFGDIRSFRDQFANLTQEQVFQTLKARLKPLCHRTLRRQVTAYIPFTKRLPLVQEFTPEEAEDRLYDLVSEYLRRPNLHALPVSQRSLMTLVLRKLLASSSFAIAGALTSISKRLKAKLGKQDLPVTLEEELDQDYEALGETAEEWEDQQPPELLSEADRMAIETEIADLDGFARLAASIDHNAKGKALIKALTIAFAKATELGAVQKAIIFTESRKTQSYLLRLLADSPWKEGIVLFNGSNTDDRSNAIYAAWLDRHQGTDHVTGSKTADMRSALVDYFREEGRIMIATEAGAEGINLQFCSLVVNYDLPWNPQRIEQRIGRCHRYGQKYDVVVVNFLNRKNDADRRVFELLSEKFQLFEGVFGVSDEVLGAIESGVDFEKRIADIYQRCRKHDEIKTAFDQLQLELSLEINEAMTQTRRKLLENFDDEVREKLKLRDNDSKAYLNRLERWLIQLTQHELIGHAEFINDSSFRLESCPFPSIAGEIPLGLYELPRRSGEAHTYRLNHPLAEAVVSQARERKLPVQDVCFDYGDHDGKISILESMVGESGWLMLSILTVQALDQIEDHLIFTAVTDTGKTLDHEQAARLFQLPALMKESSTTVTSADALESLRVSAEADLLKAISARNTKFFEAELAKLDGWADDQIATSEKALKDIKKRLRELRNEAGKTNDLVEQARVQGEIADTERRQRKLRQEIFEVEDRIKSDYMKVFEEYLEEEGVGEDERREMIFLPTITLPEFERNELELNIIRPKAEMPDFKKSVRLRLTSLEGQLNNTVIADWYPRLQKQSSVSQGGGATATLNMELLRTEHLAFLPWDTVWFELERHKRDKAYYNLLFGPDELKTLLSNSWWYELYIPPGYLEFRGMDQRGLWEDIAVHLLKGYTDRFYQFHKRVFEAPFLEYQILKPTDDLVLKEYQILVRKSEKQLIQRLRTLSEKFKSGEFEAFTFDKLDVFGASRHLYQPLIHLSHDDGKDALIKIIPTHLNEGEKQFVNDLEAFCKAEAKGMLAETELYLLRNHNSDKAISFFTETGFRPDFILWLVKDSHQTISFIDPKGMRNFTDTFNNPKVQFSRRIKELQKSPPLQRDDIRLESFLISQTYRHDLRWPSSSGSDIEATAEEYYQHHVVLSKDNPDTYIRRMMALAES